MSLGGSVGAMIASMRQNASMIRSAHRKGLDKAVLIRGIGTDNRPIQGRPFKSEAERQAFLTALANEKRRANRQLRWIAGLCLLLILAALGWMLR